MILLREKRSLSINLKIINMNLKKTVRLLVILLLVITGCSRESNKNLLQQKGKSQTAVIQLLQKIDSLGNLGEYDVEISKDYIAKAVEFAHKYPEDPMSAEFLYNAGLMAMTVAKTFEIPDETKLYSNKALTIFDDIQKIYPDFTGIKNCMLNKGIIYDDILHDYKNAEISYREFIARYQTDTLAINLESYLQYLGKSPEEIIEHIKN